MSYLLCLIGITTNMRPCEIKRIANKDFYKIEEVWFLHIPKSKTANDVRSIPIHNMVYEEIKKYAVENGRDGPDDIILKTINGKTLNERNFTQAYTEFGKLAGMSASEMKAGNYSFTSKRHFWKTLMNDEKLGEDVEEVLMGHKVSSVVAETYNHREKRGQKNLLEKARKVFKILKKYVL